ncbi:3-dehydroquinate dehydratase [Desulfocurvibacter africanus PCS]|uniref:3-dehydroquinate dehydratase n=1 Tax=Desulfocurvibacter africanus PCS TaxID=1262666 RepID=M5PX01_DESAF|nr:type II 3-dehydroquinate dehydratase [Desulfocurvibacter africanus]EMG38852.1 3-dehydroquinate dehydratase [Desulfocurvibacter africanus PCS]
MAGFDILVLNGPNLGYIGKRQPEIYGSQGMDQVPALVRELMGEKANDVRLSFFQTNSEGGLIDRLEQARNHGVHGIVFNAGAYTHTSLALADCLAWITIPCVEVHLSNIWARTDEPLRQRSYIGSRCVGVVAGFGLLSYALAVQSLWRLLSEKQTI